MEQETRKLQAMMQMHYGEEYRRKWSGFTPREMAEIWSKRFTLDGISPEVVVRLGDRLHWEHPPTLPQVMVEATRAQEEYAHEMKARATATALPNDASLAKPDSPAVQAFRAEMAKFMRRHA